MDVVQHGEEAYATGEGAILVQAGPGGSLERVGVDRLIARADVASRLSAASPRDLQRTLLRSPRSSSRCAIAAGVPDEHRRAVEQRPRPSTTRPSLSSNSTTGGAPLMK